MFFDLFVLRFLFFSYLSLAVEGMPVCVFLRLLLQGRQLGDPSLLSTEGLLTPHRLTAGLAGSSQRKKGENENKGTIAGEYLFRGGHSVFCVPEIREEWGRALPPSPPL